MSLLRNVLSVVIVFWAAASPAATFYVSQAGTTPYTTISSAMQASALGDTILVSPGTYAEGVNLNTTRRVVIGAGWDQTHITNIMSAVTTSSGSIVEGFHVVGGSNILNMAGAADSIWIRRCRFESTSVAAQLSGNRLLLEDCILTTNGTSQLANLGSARVVVRNCLLVHFNGNSTTRYAFSGANGNFEVYNCVFLGFQRLLNCTGTQPIVFINNIVYDWEGASPQWGTYLAGSIFSHNASSVIAPPGTSGILLAANPFVNYDPVANWTENSNLRPAAGAPVIDAGHPDIIDLDGSASDLGIYGSPRPMVDRGVPSYPFVLSLSISPTLIGVGDSIQVNTSGRVGPAY